MRQRKSYSSVKNHFAKCIVFAKEMCKKKAYQYIPEPSAQCFLISQIRSLAIHPPKECKRNIKIAIKFASFSSKLRKIIANYLPYLHRNSLLLQVICLHASGVSSDLNIKKQYCKMLQFFASNLYELYYLYSPIRTINSPITHLPVWNAVKIKFC